MYKVPNYIHESLCIMSMDYTRITEYNTTIENSTRQASRPERKKIMTGQEVFDILAEREMKLFYAVCRDTGNEELKAAHEAVKQALLVVHEIIYGGDTKKEPEA